MEESQPQLKDCAFKLVKDDNTTPPELTAATVKNPIMSMVGIYKHIA